MSRVLFSTPTWLLRRHIIFTVTLISRKTFSLALSVSPFLSLFFSLFLFIHFFFLLLLFFSSLFNFLHLSFHYFLLFIISFQNASDLYFVQTFIRPNKQLTKIRPTLAVLLSQRLYHNNKTKALWSGKTRRIKSFSELHSGELQKCPFYTTEYLVDTSVLCFLLFKQIYEYYLNRIFMN